MEEAKKAAAALCGLVDRVVTGQLNNGFAVIRPPGHHAEPGLAGGYCVINNVAVAAAYAKAKLGMNRILIVDWVSFTFAPSFVLFTCFCLRSYHKYWPSVCGCVCNQGCSPRQWDPIDIPG